MKEDSSLFTFRRLDGKHRVGTDASRRANVAEYDSATYWWLEFLGQRDSLVIMWRLWGLSA